LERHAAVQLETAAFYIQSWSSLPREMLLYKSTSIQRSDIYLRIGRARLSWAAYYLAKGFAARAIDPVAGAIV
jgi:hypothetical protein